jgi:histidinol-phosphatase
MNNSYRKLLDFATETVYLAGKLTLGYFQTGVHADFKEDNSPVTIADRKAEELIRARIEKQFPGHMIIGEEFGESEYNGSAHRWYIDPIDGTKSFMRGVPLYSVLLGLEIEGTVQVGAVYFPALDEMIAAATGEGCWWNGRPARVSNVARLEQAAILFTEIANFEKYGRSDAWQRLIDSSYFRAGSGDAYGYAQVATGRAELMLDPIMCDWDCGPFPPILSEAGGYFGDWQGNTTIHAKEGMATTRALLPEVLRVIEGK